MEACKFADDHPHHAIGGWIEDDARVLIAEPRTTETPTPELSRLAPQGCHFFHRRTESNASDLSPLPDVAQIHHRVGQLPRRVIGVSEEQRPYWERPRLVGVNQAEELAVKVPTSSRRTPQNEDEP